MKQYSFPRNRIWQLLLIFLLLGLMLFSRDTMMSMSLLGFYKCQFLSIGLVAVTGVCFLAVQRKRLKEIFTDDRLWLVLAAAVAVFVPMLLKRDWQLMYFSVLLWILTAFFFSYFLTIQELSRGYLLILSLLGVYSVLCTYGFRSLADQGTLAVPVFLNQSDLPFYNFGLATVSIEFVSQRNFGIFREPGVYQFFLLLGLYLNNYHADWDKAWKTWILNGILALTMLTTFATGGVIEMGLLAVFLFIDKKWYRNHWAQAAAAAVLLLLGAFAAWVLVTKNSLYVELVGMVEKFWITDPEESRFIPILEDFRNFIRHPLTGGKLSAILWEVENNTTSSMILLAGFGVLMGIFHVAGWFALTWDRRRNVVMNLILAVILAMSFNTQNLIGDLWFWIFPVMAMAERGIPAIRQRIHRKRPDAPENTEK